MNIEEAIKKMEGIDTFTAELQAAENPNFGLTLQAFKMAIASMKALEEIRQEAVDAIEDGLYVRNTRILDIIDKHIKDGDSQ